MAAFAMAQADNFVVEEVNVAPGTTKAVGIQLQNASAYTAFQFDMVLPEGIEIAKDETIGLLVGLVSDLTPEHSLYVKNIGPGTYRFLSFSETNADYPGEEGNLIVVNFAADEALEVGSSVTATIQSALLVTAEGVQLEPEELAFDLVLKDGGEGTAIRGIYGSQGDDDWYNLNGQRVKTPAKGVFIKNGKKVVKK